ncbi:hypothetical protein, partial [Burkholderia gladioli]|uniref:hypothetical protein n=1 Tax=Burkholderia gladioli TaxID=28095 RepID=UPI003F7A4B16
SAARFGASGTLVCATSLSVAKALYPSVFAPLEICRFDRISPSREASCAPSQNAVFKRRLSDPVV